ncbi:hypothetical protein AMAG_15039 [Allomyces macrogynus ATCC 38327]|uniref:Uncharacterized protein n=1 Tax=Allomyces macrogynus (strain ATCC 38327) TaxID=578462 RepID=A0A0L0T5M9_ALLM3|nr:hypothetical protein AMAG_15039 [Allomyces macrogynus ATCC 38327]|eukprot:KNE70050.1 hypothetical protein AMAG_15039 [Allomyces macrogynus ATCC 38327]
MIIYFCWRTPQHQPRQCTNSLQSSGPRSTTATMTFFTVKYGDNDERLFNSNCLNTVLLGHIKAALKLTFPEPVDLALDSGDVLDLASKPREYAKKYIEPRAVCTLLKVVQDEDDGSTAYVPLLDNAATDRFRVAGGLSSILRPHIARWDRVARAHGPNLPPPAQAHAATPPRPNRAPSPRTPPPPPQARLQTPTARVLLKALPRLVSARHAAEARSRSRRRMGAGLIRTDCMQV